MRDKKIAAQPEGCDRAAGSAPSWEDCERKFREMSAAFGVDRDKWKRLDAEYREMLAAFERTEEKGPNSPLDTLQPACTGSASRP